VSDPQLRARLDDLEGRYAFLDDLAQELEQLVTAQAGEIAQLQLELRRLRETLEAVRPDLPDATPEPPPPHY
jgi:uncharacterized coiled-coil protein SlyX